MSRNYDNWKRLVAAVLKREQIWQLCHQDSISSINSSISSHDSSADIEFSLAPLQFVKSLGLGPTSLGRLRITDSYELVRQLGQGEFGTTNLVWLSKLVSVQRYSGRAVIKWLNAVDLTENEFEQHMIVLRNCRHQNVGIPLAYYYSHMRKFIVYDYYTQGSVFDMLQAGKGLRPSWESRMRIAVGAALGVAHIHKRSLFHGNIKSSNIFLNRAHYGCVSEFGLAGMMNERRPSQKSDVYSFGLLLLELVTGESPVQASVVDRLRSFEPSQGDLYCFEHDRLLVDEHDMAVEATERFPFVDLDVNISGHGVHQQLQKTLQLAKSCLAVLPESRPSMSDVALKLESTANFHHYPVEKKRVKNRR